MKLFTDDIIKKLKSNAKLGDVPLAKAKPVCKFFAPHGSWTWYPFSMDEDGYCFGLVVGHEIEYGMFHRSELEEYDGFYEGMLAGRHEFAEQLWDLINKWRIKHGERE